MTSHCARTDECSRPLEFANIPLTDQNGYVVKVGDIAHIEDSVAEPESIATVDGKPAVVMIIRKQSGNEHRGGHRRLKEKIGRVKTTLPKKGMARCSLSATSRTTSSPRSMP